MELVMVWLLGSAFAVAAAALTFAVLRWAPVGHSKAGAPPAPGMSVTLSVLPTRTALIVLDVEADAPSADVSRLVEHAIRDAFVFDGVDVVEVRRRTGETLERRHRAGALRVVRTPSGD